MKDLVDRFIKIEQRIAQQRGGFSLFALFLREDSPDKWDMVVAAPWINGDKGAALRYLAGQLQSELSQEELLRLSRIVIVEPDNPALNAIHNAIQIEHGGMEIQNSTFFGLSIKHGYIITSANPPTSVEAFVGV